MFEKYFDYDETSPSCLRWKIDMYYGINNSTLLCSSGQVAGS